MAGKLGASLSVHGMDKHSELKRARLCVDWTGRRALQLSCLHALDGAQAGVQPMSCSRPAMATVDLLPVQSCNCSIEHKGVS